MLLLITMHSNTYSVQQLLNNAALQNNEVPAVGAAHVAVTMQPDMGQTPPAFSYTSPAWWDRLC